MKKILILFVFLLSSQWLLAWSNHGLGTWMSLFYIKTFSQSPFVRVESLEDFLEKEKSGIALLLTEMDGFFQEKMSKIYPPLPKELHFSADSENLRKDFLTALRLNPNTRLGYYIQEMPGIPLRKKTYPQKDITTYKNYDFLKENRFLEIGMGSIQSPLYVLSTAVDEPDYGMDVGLFEDNDTTFGNLYGFGIQPFGDPKYEYSAQAPFHMGFYYEDSIIYTFAGFLEKTYPELRAYQFLRLSEYAFKTGHDYWGYRFLGWGLHYIQDLTQPYHARVLPQYTSGKMIRINLLAMIGLDSSKSSAVERASNRHNFIETYHHQTLREKMESRFSPSKDKFLFAYRERDVTAIPEDIYSYIREEVASESFAVSDELDSNIEDYAMDLLGKKWNYSELEKNSYREKMDETLVRLNRNFGYHTRTILSWARGRKF